VGASLGMPAAAQAMAQAASPAGPSGGRLLRGGSAAWPAPGDSAGPAHTIAGGEGPAIAPAPVAAAPVTESLVAGVASRQPSPPAGLLPPPFPLLSLPTLQLPSSLPLPPPPPPPLALAVPLAQPPTAPSQLPLVPAQQLQLPPAVEGRPSFGVGSAGGSYFAALGGPLDFEEGVMGGSFETATLQFHCLQLPFPTDRSLVVPSIPRPNLIRFHFDFTFVFTDVTLPRLFRPRRFPRR
jgi:hypothetical protein